MPIPSHLEPCRILQHRRYSDVHLRAAILSLDHHEPLNRSRIVAEGNNVANPQLSTIGIHGTNANWGIGGKLLKARPVMGIGRPIPLRFIAWKWCGCLHGSVMHLPPLHEWWTKMLLPLSVFGVQLNDLSSW